MSKKLLSFAVAICMLMQIFSMVAVASTEEDFGIELAGTTEKFSKQYANDNFASGTDGWVVGTSVTDYEATITTVDDAGAKDGKALKITFPDAGSGSKEVTGKYGTVIKLLDDPAIFSAEETVTVKARVKADTAMRYQIKANRPNSLVQPDNDYTWPFYYGLLMHGDDNKLQVLGSGLYASEIGQTTYNYRANTEIATNNDTGLWTEYTIVFKPAEKNIM